MDGLELLKQDHDTVNALFRQFEQGGNSQEFEMLFTQLYDALVLHTIIEEQVLYPMLKTMPETASLAREAYNEHGQAKLTLTKIASLDNTSTEWGQMMTTLMREITQHVQEEEGTIFPKLRQLMSEAQLRDLGDQLQQAKDKGINSAVLKELSQTGATAATPYTQTMPTSGMRSATVMTDMDLPPVITVQPTNSNLVKFEPIMWTRAEPIGAARVFALKIKEGCFETIRCD